ncbi:MAG: hypothetical protein WAZ98_13920 [Cyclobacteriaceae bacterium]
MKKLEDIPKNHPFKVPEGYFDRLPGLIQARVSEKTSIWEAKPIVRYALQYALPVLVLAVASILYLVPDSSQDADSLLASVSTEELVTYLQESGITTDELLDELQFDNESIEAIEAEVYFNFKELDDLEEFDLDVNNL